MEPVLVPRRQNPPVLHAELDVLEYRILGRVVSLLLLLLLLLPMVRACLLSSVLLESELALLVVAMALEEQLLLLKRLVSRLLVVVASVARRVAFLWVPRSAAISVLVSPAANHILVELVLVVQRQGLLHGGRHTRRREGRRQGIAFG